MIAYAAALLIAYAIGGISFGYLAGRISRGVDLRTIGSGNVGATNVIREVGTGWGILVLILDMLKGVAAVLVGERLIGAGNGPIFAGFAAILGHSFTPFLGFRGGKSVATSAGVFFTLAPFATGIALFAFIVTLLMTRMVSAGSLLAALVLPLALAWRNTENRVLIGLGLLVTVLIWLRHRANLGRILRGEESRLSFSRPEGK